MKKSSKITILFFNHILYIRKNFTNSLNRWYNCVWCILDFVLFKGFFEFIFIVAIFSWFSYIRKNFTIWFYPCISWSRHILDFLLFKNFKNLYFYLANWLRFLFSLLKIKMSLSSLFSDHPFSGSRLGSSISRLPLVDFSTTLIILFYIFFLLDSFIILIVSF